MARTDSTAASTTPQRSALQVAALAVGATFLLVGVLGFVPGVTQDYDSMELAGPDSRAKLLGLFQVSILHNVVHLLFGVAGVVAARTMAGARLFLIGGGLIYGALFVYGMVIDKMSDANFVPVNDADNWLHFGLAAGMLVLGLVLPSRTATR